MKKILAFLLVVAMTFGMVACNSTGDETTSTSASTRESTSDTTSSDTTETTTEESTTTETTTEEETTTETQIPVTPVNTAFDETKIVLSFAAISDTQHKYSGIDTLAKFRTALKQLKEYATEHGNGLDAVVFAGDMVQSAKSQEVREFKTAYEAVINPEETPLIFSLGNHDVKVSYTVEDLKTESFYQIFGDSYRSYEEETSRVDLGCTHTVINDYHFLCLNPTNESYGTYGDGGVLYTAEVKAWLDETLSAITTANPDHYVFVNTHPMIYDTVYGSTLVTNGGTQWFTKDLTSILEKYNQVVTFGGHLHFPLNDPKSIMQTAFTSLGCASVTYMAIENGGYENMSSATVMKDAAQVSQGLMVQIDENGNMRITRMDFQNDDTIQEPWEIPAPASDGSHLTYYGKDRGNEENNVAPVLPDLKTVMGKTTSIGKQQVTLEFAKAEDDDFAHHYVITLNNKTAGTTVRTLKILADFYLHPKKEDMKAVYTQNLGYLDPGVEYEVIVEVYDSWGASDSKTLTFSITGESSDAQ